MIRGLLRVAARTAAIQLEAATAARDSGRVVSGSRDRGTEWPANQSHTSGDHRTDQVPTYQGKTVLRDEPISANKDWDANAAVSPIDKLVREQTEDSHTPTNLGDAESHGINPSELKPFATDDPLVLEGEHRSRENSHRSTEVHEQQLSGKPNDSSEVHLVGGQVDQAQQSQLMDSAENEVTAWTKESTSSVVEENSFDHTVPETPRPVSLRPSKVPNSRLGRMLHYGSLVAGMSLGAASEAVRRSTGSGGTGSLFMSEANVRRLVDKLGRMRGAALKLGQFMSIQDTNMLPEQLERVLQQVQANAHYMPDWQLEDVMKAELGENWADRFSEFERVPIASASIGQVHRAKAAVSGLPVAVKVQFPGIASSITSDLDNLSLLLKTSALLPRGLYLDNTLAVMRRELADECDYVKEAASGRRFREMLKDDPLFEVPQVIDELTSAKVLTTEFMSGRPLSEIKHLDQATRDKIGEAVLRLCLKELFVFRFMQTDPNWANFLYDKDRGKLQLIDFGASREYTIEFMDNWYRLLTAALTKDREEMVKQSLRLRYLTGDEEEEMIEAHIQSMSLLATPFITPGVYDFGQQSVTDEVRKLIPTMLRHRLTPPPNETYSLNRKLSGCFLLCAKLGARVDCQTLWQEVVGDYKVSTGYNV